ncbi:trimethylamine methyltransferase family protein [Candidatus Formimonas warabiya]|uniref:Methyltransferase n=1 Tax=Formimonas warabiya TaxID=1761012 RepID=A0A3G1KZR4_FORW1|nr:trimethylamine methyltransferase family protein [Candidatus Formimonas warabiya]ATW27879.1 trimethylamine--corrinoid methyltransferase [Candidatus Formimonas warabiya]
MQKYEVLKKDQIEQIHETTMNVLEKIGVEFRYGPALDVFAKAGVKVEGQRVFLSRKMVEEQIKKAPGQFTLYARNPEKNVLLGGDSLVFTPGYGSPFITDLDRGKRQGTLEDFHNLAKLSGASPYQDLTGGILVEPNDIPTGRRHVEMAYSCIKNSDKCFMGSSYGDKCAQDIVKMMSLVFGPEWNPVQKPALLTLINSITPLIFDERMLGALMEYAKTGQAVVITSLTMAGATGPATLAGSLVCQNAEVLAGITLAQLIREGTPVIYGSASSITEMSTGSLTIGAPEMSLLTAASAQMARYYHLPCRGGGAISDVKTADAQAGYESMMNLLITEVSGINFVLHAAGIIESYNTISYEKFIIDDEICGMVKRIKKSFDVNQETLAFDVIKEVGPGGHFLDKEHTFHHFRGEFYRPALSNRTTYEMWKENGSRQAMEVANKKWKEILSNYQPPELPAQVDKALQKFMGEIK